MGHVAAVFDQAGFRWRNDDGNEATATYSSALNASVTLEVGVVARCRVIMDETAGGAENNVSTKWQYQLNSGGWNDITTVSSVVRAATSTQGALDGTATTQQISSGTFVSAEVTEDGLSDSVRPSFSGNESSELELVFQLVSADVADADTVEIRALRADGTTFGTYSQTPTLTVSKSAESFAGTVAFTEVDDSVAASGPGGDGVSASALTGTATDTDATSHTTGSIAHGGDNKVVVAAVLSWHASLAPNVPTLTGPAGTSWAQVNSVLFDNSGSQRRLTVFVGTASSETSGTVDIDFAGQTQGAAGWSFTELSNVDTSQGTSGVVQSAAAGDGSTVDSTQTVTLSAFGDTNNAVFAAFGTGANTTGTPEASLSELHDVNNSPSTEDFSLVTAWGATEDATPSITWGSSDVVGAVAFETARFTGISTVSGTTSFTESDDSLASSGTSTPPARSGTVAFTESDDTSDSSGTSTPPAVSGTVTFTEVDDTVEASGSTGAPTLAGDVSFTETDDTLAAAGTSTPPARTGTVSYTESSDALASAGQVDNPGFSGTVSFTETDDSVSVSGTSVAPSGGGTVSFTEVDDTVTVSGTHTPGPIAATVTYTEQPDSLSASASYTADLSSDVAFTETSDSFTASGFFVPASGKPAASVATVSTPAKSAVSVGPTATSTSVVAPVAVSTSTTDPS